RTGRCGWITSFLRSFTKETRVPCCLVGCVGGAICLGECPGGGCSWVEHWLLQNFPCRVCLVPVVVCGCWVVWWGHTVGLPGNEPLLVGVVGCWVRPACWCLLWVLGVGSSVA